MGSYPKFLVEKANLVFIRKIRINRMTKEIMWGFFYEFEYSSHIHEKNSLEKFTELYKSW